MTKENIIRLLNHYKEIGRDDLIEDVKSKAKLKDSSSYYKAALVETKLHVLPKPKTEKPTTDSKTEVK